MIFNAEVTDLNRVVFYFGLFNDAVSFSDTIASNYRKISEQ